MPSSCRDREHRDPRRAVRLRGPRAGLFAVFSILVFGCAPGTSASLHGQSENEAFSQGKRETYARINLENARRLRSEGHLEFALRTIDRGLELQPHNHRLYRLRGQILSDLGLEEEARVHFEKAKALAPRRAALSQSPVQPTAFWSDALVVLLPPPVEGEPGGPTSAERLPEDWALGEAASVMRERLAVRMPGAQVLTLDRKERDEHVRSVASVRSWLEEESHRAAISLRIDRAFCGESLKDGEFAVAWLRIAQASGRRIPPPVDRVRYQLEDPEDCRRSVLAHALEMALALPSVEALPASGHEEGRWSHREVRALFPSLDLRVDEAIEEARLLLAGGRTAKAAEALRRAQTIDPEDESAVSMLRDVERSVVLSRELSVRSRQQLPAGAWRREEDPERFDPGFTPDQVRQLERLLAEEKRRHDDQLAAIEALETGDEPPSPIILAALRPSVIRDPQALGPRLARSRGDQPIKKKVLFAPDGTILARFYFAGSNPEPVLLEELVDGNDVPDRWVAYPAPGKKEVWKDDAGSGNPRLHISYSADQIDQIEVDDERIGRVNRILIYKSGQLARELLDTNGDGRYDRKDIIDRSGNLNKREEDLDGDGEVDVRTHYRDGRIRSREILNPVGMERANTPSTTPGSRKLQ